MNYSSIIVTGSMAYDEIMNFPSRFMDVLHPDQLHQINVSFVVDRLEKQRGGTGTNIAYSLALLKLPIATLLLSSVGKDGNDLSTFMKENGVDTSGILVDESVYTATGKVITDINNNQIWGFYYGACERGKDITLADYAKKDSFVIVSANHPKAFIHFQEETISGAYDYMYDPGMGLSWITDEDLKQGIEHATYVIGNDYEIELIERKLHTPVLKLLKNGAALITTLGKEGVRYSDGIETYTMSAYHSELIDPTGAGDAFRSGFVGGLIQQMPIPHCLALGNVMASFAIEQYGTVNQHPTKKEITDRLQTLVTG